jgi:FtsP/CotA-like multicopper oxidase with cupredoxin domain
VEVTAALSAAPLLALLFLGSAAPAVERIAINDNRSSAGVLRGGVLTIRLEAREGEWHPDGDSDPGIVVRAFAEEGKAPLIPGPLIRVPEGTVIRAFVRNTLPQTLTLRGMSTRGSPSGIGADTVQIAPGATREMRFIAGAPGTYYYHATTPVSENLNRATMDSELSGAFIIDPRGSDSRGSPAKPPDRVFVIALWSSKTLPGGIVGVNDVLRLTINGRSWPNTERLAYNLGDTVRFRVINVSSAVHPMHLHGFYFNVDSRGDGNRDSLYDAAASPQAVVTERLTPGRTMTMTWIPERAGNWLFHCHDNFHVLRSAPLDGTRLPPGHTLHVSNHALEMMGGLVMGIEVRGRARAEVVAQGSARRTLRLVARVDSGGSSAEPAYGYELQDPAAPRTSSRPLLPGPTIVLKRGEPVSITVVNELPEATAVHWHGIELESYFDGVAGFAGSGTHIAPAIAPRDSFEAQFTPPRSGTFIYHPHADEYRQQQAGLSGALLVVDSPDTYDPATDIVLLLTVPRRDADRATILLNGSMKPAPLDLRVGQRYRLRLVDIHTYRPSMIARLVRDSTPVAWRAVAKDGMDLPSDQATTRPAVQQMGNGETYDFELTPTAAEDLRFIVSTAAGVQLLSMPVRVR